MQDIPFFQVDAFTDHVFGGNPAAVMPFNSWPSDEILQAIAVENNLSETAFIVPEEGEGAADYSLRWFTPGGEVKLCGHATMAAAHVVFTHLRADVKTVLFDSLSGLLSVTKEGDMMVLDFPSDPLPAKAFPEHLSDAMGTAPSEAFRGGRDWMLVYDSQLVVEGLTPNMQVLSEEKLTGFIATARGAGDVDFISRFFAPAFGINEDPVTGSAHTNMAPYWAEKLGKTSFYAKQLSPRGGDLWITLKGDRVHIKGQAVGILQGVFSLST